MKGNGLNFKWIILLLLSLCLLIWGCDGGCGGPQNPEEPAGPADFELKHWTLVAMEQNGSQIDLWGEMAATLYFNYDTKRLSGTVQCNEYYAIYGVNEFVPQIIDLSTIALMKVDCGTAQEELTNSLLGILGSMRNYTVEADTLTIVAMWGDKLIFKLEEANTRDMTGFTNFEYRKTPKTGPCDQIGDINYVGIYQDGKRYQLMMSVVDLVDNAPEACSDFINGGGYVDGCLTTTLLPTRRLTSGETSDFEAIFKALPLETKVYTSENYICIDACDTRTMLWDGFSLPANETGCFQGAVQTVGSEAHQSLLGLFNSWK